MRLGATSGQGNRARLRFGWQRCVCTEPSPTVLRPEGAHLVVRRELATRLLGIRRREVGLFLGRELKDRSKDIIISGGENISSIEVEDALFKHPSVAAAAVVAKPDAKWGETPCAFVELREGKEVTPEELVAWCRERLAPYKLPRHVVFGELPKTSTGKVQKFLLREKAREGDA